MKSSSLPSLVALVGLIAAGPAIAGHEWTDGTMGPPVSRSYDTTMPTFPSAKRPAPRAPEDQSQVCVHGANLTAGSGAVARSANPRAGNQPTTNAELRETCRTQSQ